MALVLSPLLLQFDRGSGAILVNYSIATPVKIIVHNNHSDAGMVDLHLAVF